ncbi:hypothetical protein Hanom_Chr07g00643651 [Helianthus anomalus]
MELMSRMKMAKDLNLLDPDAKKQTFGRKSRETGQTSGTKMAFYSSLYLHYILSLSSMLLRQILDFLSQLKVLMTWIHPTARNRSLMLLGPVLKHFNLGFSGSHRPRHSGYHKRRITHLTDDFFSLFG